MSAAPEPAGETAGHLRGSSLLLVGRLFSTAIHLAIQILIVRHLSQTGFGAFAFGLAIVSLTFHFTVLGLDKTLSRFVPMYQEEERDDLIVGALLLCVAVIGLLGAASVLIVIGTQQWLNEAFIHDEQATAVLVVLISLGPLRAFDSVVISIFAAMAQVGSIFVRRYLVGPLLQVGAVGAVIVTGGDVVSLALAYVLASLVGTALNTALMMRLLSSRGILGRARQTALAIPASQILRYSVPLMSTELVQVLRGAMIPIFLQAFHGAAAVASFRAVLPIARENTIVQSNLTYLYIPAASRLFFRNDHEKLDDLYWQSAIWITLLTFPIFLLSFSLAEPLILVLFGERYADSAAILSWLALGYYLNAALGFNGLTLRVFGHVRYIVTVDFAMALVSLLVTVVLVSQFGALGGGIAVSSTMVLQNALYHAGVWLRGGIHPLPRRYVGTYALLIATAVVVMLASQSLQPAPIVALTGGVLISAVLVFFCRRTLNLLETFPELSRLRWAKWLIS